MRSAPPIGRPLSEYVRRPYLPATTEVRSSYSPSTVLPIQTTVTTGGTAHVMGAWSEVVAAAAYDIAAIDVRAPGAYLVGSSGRALLDFGVGGAGAEVAIVSSIDIGQMQGSGGVNTITVPVFIARGTRIAIRVQSVLTATACVASIRLCPYVPREGVMVPKFSVTYGANRADSTGTLLTPGAATAKGAWTQVVPATTQPLGGLVPVVGCGDYGNTANRYGLVDVAVGAAGAEVVIAENLYWYVTSSEVFSYQGAMIPIDLPAGVRLSARASVQMATYIPSIILHGVPKL